jgi:hypothetical protein
MADFVEVLGRVLDERAARDRSVRTARVVGRNTDGTTQLLRLDGQCVSRGCGTSQYPGETIETAVTFCAKDIGTSGITTTSSQRGANLVWIESLSPELYAAGESYTVEVVGFGFDERTRIEFLLPDSLDVNPDVTIDEIRVITSELLEVDITLAEEAEAVTAASISYDNGGPL